jgi:hypothetical protein
VPHSEEGLPGGVEPSPCQPTVTILFRNCQI